MFSGFYTVFWLLLCLSGPPGFCVGSLGLSWVSLGKQWEKQGWTCLTRFFFVFLCILGPTWFIWLCLVVLVVCVPLGFPCFPWVSLCCVWVWFVLVFIDFYVFHGISWFMNHSSAPLRINLLMSYQFKIIHCYSSFSVWWLMLDECLTQGSWFFFRRDRSFAGRLGQSFRARSSNSHSNSHI